MKMFIERISRSIANFCPTFPLSGRKQPLHLTLSLNIVLLPRLVRRLLGTLNSLIFAWQTRREWKGFAKTTPQYQSPPLRWLLWFQVRLKLSGEDSKQRTSFWCLPPYLKELLNLRGERFVLFLNSLLKDCGCSNPRRWEISLTDKEVV